MKSKFLTFILSIAPGVGHFYLGLMNRGAQLLLAFFGTIFISSFLRLEELAILLPVIWFYSLFDALQHHSLVNEGIKEDVPVILWDNIKLNQRWIAYTLIGVGGYILFDNLFYNVARYFDFLYHFDIKTILVAIIFIYIGFRLLTGTKQKINEEKNV
jgi:hypothetical protein